ncbi:hypothetical protein [Mycoplasma zalophi]|uniref:hypothetical protein n=1 Tax=Mycoplasma zalophi TaxID=191287 RepID=UPI001C11645E|nr:hypothetical protein [Mycoplasma zalophi]MBU4690911.1 hypothetical protein [Mycoplasma zalophi]
MKKQYISKIEGIFDFYQELGITPSYHLNTDGVINRTLIKFKKNNDSKEYNLLAPKVVDTIIADYYEMEVR